jgi:hypothetical protein
MHDLDIHLDLRPLKEKPNAPAKGRLTLHVAIEPTAADPGGLEGINTPLQGPRVPATIDLALTAGGTAGTAGVDAAATWAALEPLHGLLTSPVLANLVDAIDKLAKVCVVILIYGYQCSNPV